MNDEGVLDPWVADWLTANPRTFKMMDIYTMARGNDLVFPISREIASVIDDEIEGIRVRVYEAVAAPTSLIVYFHGGGFCVGSIAIMDNVARELAAACDATVISVEYRLAPEHPYPAGLDDCERVTRWVLQNRDRYTAADTPVLLAGESAGGNLAAALSLRLRDAGVTGEGGVAGQVLIYPGTAGDGSAMPSRSLYAGYTMDSDELEWCWNAYSGGVDITRDPYAAPLQAPSLAGLPPAIVILGGCDFLRDEGRAYAQRLAAEGVDTVEVMFPGQIHGFINHGHPAAAEAFERIGAWSRALDSHRDHT